MHMQSLRSRLNLRLKLGAPWAESSKPNTINTNDGTRLLTRTRVLTARSNLAGLSKEAVILEA